MEARQYEEFQPEFSWMQDGKSNTLALSLQGYRKDQLKVQLDSLGNLKISGERATAGNKWTRFKKDFRIPESSNISDIRAKFENGNLYVIIPKMVSATPATKPSLPSSNTRQAQESPQKAQEAQKDDKRTNGLQDDKKTMNEKSEDKKEKNEGAEKTETGVVKEPVSHMQGRSSSKLMEAVRLRRPNRKLAVNAAVAALVVLGFGIYLAYKFWPIRGDTGKSESMLDV